MREICESSQVYIRSSSYDESFVSAGALSELRRQMRLRQRWNYAQRQITFFDSLQLQPLCSTVSYFRSAENTCHCYFTRGLLLPECFNLFNGSVTPGREFDLWPWTTNLTWIGSRLNQQAIYAKSYFGENLSPEHNTQPTNCIARPLNRSILAKKTLLLWLTFFHILYSLLPPPRSAAITSRLRSSQTFPKAYTRTKRYCSLIQCVPSYNFVFCHLM